MRSYSDLFRTREFTPLFLSSALNSAASTIAGLAVGTLVYRATDSPLLSAVSMFGPQLAQVVGATTLLSAADRLAPRATMTGIALSFAVGTAVMATPGLPVWGLFLLISVLGLVSSLGGGVRWGLLNEILSKDGYLLGRSVFNMANGLTQITGYATGGVLVAVLSPRTTLAGAAVLYLAAALITRFGMTRRAPRATGRPSIAQTWRTNALLWSSRPRRTTYLLLWIPNGLIVGCESLYVSYAPDRAGLLFAFAAFGMFVGDVTTGRFVPPAVRGRLGIPFLLLLATPYLLFALRPGVAVAAGAVALASVGFGASLIQQERLMALTPDELSGHALGLHSSGMLTMQGVSAALAGSVAQLTSPGTAMTLMAITSIAATLLISGSRQRPEVSTPQQKQPEVNSL
ncbi:MULTISPECIES: MFS transporter [Streptomyces]|uniref:MFS transporter n=1 Tax=Streptomyces mirabilis TaxID=68239 RepID=A0ABU3URS4_9ACTN|nr:MULTISPECIES: MFS transporter [Streptomyces]MDU8996631.1 MFS transporter [Streptomyces mirabilis]NMI59043.1 MFS transporter [Streptomyces sp. RLA2-12]QDN58323.1 MFS transporter [Streptomyces sp. S1D4-20]QDN68417.1 MFS transporter [Streptomyces sp. S1D4-14]QDN88395.1 MFS transporter [Streptomyces sp. RLB3-6]